jgi:hypothetical protein
LIQRSALTTVRELRNKLTNDTEKRIGASIVPLLLPLDISHVINPNATLGMAHPDFYGILVHENKPLTVQQATEPKPNCPLSTEQSMPYMEHYELLTATPGNLVGVARLMPYSVHYYDVAFTDRYHCCQHETQLWANNNHEVVSKILAKTNQTYDQAHAQRNYRSIVQEDCVSVKTAYHNARLSIGRSLTIPSTIKVIAINDETLYDTIKHYTKMLKETLVLGVTIHSTSLHSDCHLSYKTLLQNIKHESNRLEFQKQLINCYGYVPI